MKLKHFKIKGTTLFVYKAKMHKPDTDTATTDPTTTMVTLTKTGILYAGN